MAYPTLAQFKTFRGIAGAGDDAILTQILNGTIEAVEEYCNTSFIAVTKTETYPARDPYVKRNGLDLYLFEHLLTVTTLTNGDAEVIAAANYDLRDRSPYHKIVLRNGLGYRFRTDGEDTPISVAGTWGYSAACPADIFLEIMRIVSMYYSALQDGEGTILTSKGLVIDKSNWTPTTLRILNRKARR